jgi:hypothetical protein
MSELGILGWRAPIGDMRFPRREMRHRRFGPNLMGGQTDGSCRVQLRASDSPRDVRSSLQAHRQSLEADAGMTGHRRGKATEDFIRVRKPINRSCLFQKLSGGLARCVTPRLLARAEATGCGDCDLWSCLNARVSGGGLQVGA